MLFYFKLLVPQLVPHRSVILFLAPCSPDCTSYKCYSISRALFPRLYLIQVLFYFKHLVPKTVPHTSVNFQLVVPKTVPLTSVILFPAPCSPDCTSYKCPLISSSLFPRLYLIQVLFYFQLLVPKTVPHTSVF